MKFSSIRLVRILVGALSLCLFLWIWHVGSEAYGSFILPSPIDTWNKLYDIIQTEKLQSALIDSSRRAFISFLITVVFGTTLGIIAGLNPLLSAAIKPLVTLCLGIPPVAWIILALIWFGLGDGTPIFTVVISTFPILFSNAWSGMVSRDKKFDRLASVLGLAAWQRVIYITLPHLATYVFPAAILALAAAWKVTIMAEVLSATGGLGDQLAATRHTLDTAGTLALISIMTGILLIVQWSLLEPLRKRIEQWR